MSEVCKLGEERSSEPKRVLYCRKDGHDKYGWCTSHFVPPVDMEKYLLWIWRSEVETLDKERSLEPKRVLYCREDHHDKNGWCT